MNITSRIRAVVLLTALALVGATTSRATEFVWIAGATWGDGSNAAFWNYLGQNWQGGVSPINNNPGDTVTITNKWPTTAYGTRLIQLRANTTIGVLNFNTEDAGGTISPNGGACTFNNNGSHAQMNGLGGTSQLNFNPNITLADTLEVNVPSSVPKVYFGGTISGPGGLIVNAPGSTVYIAASQLYTGETRIQSGSTLKIMHSTTWNATTSIVVNGVWRREFGGGSYLSLAPGQVLSGTGTVTMGHWTYAIRSGGAKIAPGDGGIGTLSFAEVLQLTNSLNSSVCEFEVGEAASDKVATSILDITPLPGKVKIVDRGRQSLGTVSLFTYTTLYGAANFAQLGLEIPSNWTATLVNNTAGKSIDLNITKLPPRGTTIAIR
jgi:hypothetical protein